MSSRSFLGLAREWLFFGGGLEFPISASKSSISSTAALGAGFGAGLEAAGGVYFAGAGVALADVTTGALFELVSMSARRSSISERPLLEGCDLGTGAETSAKRLSRSSRSLECLGAGLDPLLA